MDEQTTQKPFDMTADDAANILSGYERLIERAKEVGAEYVTVFKTRFYPDDVDSVEFENGEILLQWTEYCCGDADPQSMRFPEYLLYMSPSLRADTIQNLKTEHDRDIVEKAKKAKAKREKEIMDRERREYDRLRAKFSRSDPEERS